MFLVGVVGSAVVVVVKKLKRNHPALLVRADNRTTEAAAIGEKAGENQKPDHHSVILFRQNVNL